MTYKCKNQLPLSLTLSSSFHVDFKQNFRAAPIQAVDVYNVLCRTLEVEPLPNNGSWSRVQNLLNNSGSFHLPTTQWICAMIFLGALLSLRQ